MESFYKLREMKELQKKPGTSELLDWLQALVIAGVPLEKIKNELPFIGVLLKKNQDIDAVSEVREKGYSLRRWV
jgi:MoxR-like ATPase